MTRCRMNALCLPPDRISNLPLSIIEMILTLMPIRDAFRTSILSRKWRYYCINIPKLEFDKKLFQGSTYYKIDDISQFLLIVYSVLLLHHEPVFEFSLDHSELGGCCEIDKIILHLSRNTTLEKFTLCAGYGNTYKLNSSFFSLQKLTHLKLENCEIRPPTTSVGFSMLRSLWLDGVIIDVNMFLSLLRCCPLLKSLTLISCGNLYSKFVELLRCLPLIEHLRMDCFFCQPLPFGDTLERRGPNMLVHLRTLQLNQLSFSREHELPHVLLLITSSPNIEKINLETFYNPGEAISFDLHDYSYVILDKLREMEITKFSNTKSEMDFVKFILSKSPTLKTVRIVIDNEISVSDELKILRDLLWIPRASNGARIKLERL